MGPPVNSDWAWAPAVPMLLESELVCAHAGKASITAKRGTITKLRKCLGEASGRMSPPWLRSDQACQHYKPSGLYSFLTFLTKQPPMSSTAHGSGSGERTSTRRILLSASSGTASSPSGSACTLASDCAEDIPPSVRRGGDWCRSGGEPRNSASSRRVNSPRSRWRLFGGEFANGYRVGTPGGGSPLVSGAGRCAGLGTGRRTMFGSITTSFRPPTSTRCSILSRRTSMILRFPSSWTDFDYSYPS